MAPLTVQGRLIASPPLTPRVAALLERAMFPDPERVSRALEAYRTSPECLLLVWEVGGEVVCAAGLRMTGQEAELLHIGTLPQASGQGYGRALVHAVADHLGLMALRAETDEGAAGFYRRAGFEVSELSSPWGARRFACVLKT